MKVTYFIQWKIHLNSLFYYCSLLCTVRFSGPIQYTFGTYKLGVVYLHFNNVFSCISVFLLKECNRSYYIVLGEATKSLPFFWNPACFVLFCFYSPWVIMLIKTVSCLLLFFGSSMIALNGQCVEENLRFYTFPTPSSDSSIVHMSPF